MIFHLSSRCTFTTTLFAHIATLLYREFLSQLTLKMFRQKPKIFLKQCSLIFHIFEGLMNTTVRIGQTLYNSTTIITRVQLIDSTKFDSIIIEYILITNGLKCWRYVRYYSKWSLIRWCGYYITWYRIYWWWHTMVVDWVV